MLFDEAKKLKSVRIKFLSIKKTAVMMLTCAAILQIDFPLLFPRYQVKAEDYGWSMMDIGVSSVMFASGLTNRLIVRHRNTANDKPFIT